jgi:hypothetical protein
VRLPDVSGLSVACDTEGSGLYADDGARISAVSCAWRDSDGDIQSFATPFDQGICGAVGQPAAPLPLGPKVLPVSHHKRITKWEAAHLTAPNRSPAAWDHLLRWLSRQYLTMHHKKYDCLMFCAGQRGRPDARYTTDVGTQPWDGGAIDLMPITHWDTQLAQSVLDPGEPTSLKPTSVRLHLGAQIGIEDGAEADEAEALAPWKGPRTDPRFDLIPWSILGPYSRTDAVLTLLLAEHNHARLDQSSPTWKHIQDELRLAQTLYYMELRAVGFDVAGCRDEERKLVKLITEAAHAVPFKGGNGKPTPPGAVKYFFGPPSEGGQGLLPYNDKLTATKRPQVDEEVIARLVKRGVAGAQEYADYAELQSARSKWYAPYQALTGTDGRIRTVHRQAHVVSGRLSVERWQAQALPHDYQIPSGLEPIRNFIGEPPDSGFQDWEADVSQAEIRVATAVARESAMLRALKSGTDSHDAACALMFYDGETDIAALKSDPAWEEYRQVAKRCNLGILYGIGAGGLRTQILKFTGREVSQDQTRGWIDDWKGVFPRFKQALYDYADMATTQGFVRLTTGRVRRFSDYEPVHKAFNQRVQGDVAEAMKEAMNTFDRAYPGLLMLQIHDSLVARIPIEDVEQVTAAMRAILVRTFERMFRPVPFKADVKPFGATAARLAA